MAEAKIIDIDGIQWTMKDETARNKIASLEENNTTKDLQDITVNLEKEFEAESITISHHYSYGKIHFAIINIVNIKGPNIGTSQTSYIAALNIYAKKSTTFLMYDYKNNAIARGYIFADGKIALGESIGVVQGNNIIYGEIIFAEP